MTPKILFSVMISGAKHLSIYVYFVMIFAKFNSAYNPNAENIRQSVFNIGRINRVNVISSTYNLNNGQIKSKLVIGVRSRVECSVLCRSEIMFACKELKYEISSGKCKLVNVFIPRVNDLPSEIQVRYSLKEACPPDTTYVPLIRSCLILVTQKMSWYDARTRCNNMPLRFHPLVISSPDVTLALIIFLNSLSTTITSQCTNPWDWTIWTAGVWYRFSGGSFTWQPYQYGASIPFSYLNWGTNQPDYFNLNNGCLHPFLNNFQWDDIECARPDFCVICQLDLY